MITFSVVTITYNAADVLKPTLDSVLRQSFPTIEHIIVDGASTDNTLAIADAYKELSDSAENGHVVRIKSEPDKGLYDAMNKGVARANGDYVVFLNAGDRFPAADTIEKVALAAEVGDGERRPAVVYGDTDIVDEKRELLISSQAATARKAVLAFVPRWHVGMPSSILRPIGHCPENTF